MLSDVYQEEQNWHKGVAQIACLLYAGHRDPEGVLAAATGIPRSHALHAVQTTLMLHHLRQSYAMYGHQ